MSSSPQSPGLPAFNAVQRRVFGVLIEKSLTTPGGYPMTLNSLVTGCNQLTCREPVMQLTEGEIARALHELQIWRDGAFVRQAEVDRTARANRFEHLAEQRLGWAKRERAIMAELLLRGAQTAGELKTNASRMTPFDDLQMVMNLLEELARHDPPYLRELPRQPGKNTVRYDHLLYDVLPDDTPAHPTSAGPAESPRVPTASPSEPAPQASAALEARVARLETELANLREGLDSLRRELGISS